MRTCRPRPTPASATESCSGSQPSHGPADLGAPQPQAAFGQDLQAQPRSAVCRPVDGCGGVVSESARQVPGVVRGREEPNPGARPHATRAAAQAGPLRHAHARRQTQRDDDPVRGTQHARRPGHRRLYAPPSASRVHSLPDAHRPRHPGRPRSASDRRQLRHAQAPPGEGLAPPTPAVSLALHPDVEFLAKLGRTVVPRTHRQTDPARGVPERGGPHRGHSRVPQPAQPAAAGVRLECSGGTSLGQDRQM